MVSSDERLPKGATPDEVADVVEASLGKVEYQLGQARDVLDDNPKLALIELDEAELALTRAIVELRRYVTDTSYTETLAKLTKVRENPANTYTEGA